jgi:hypothetical protein
LNLALDGADGWNDAAGKRIGLAHPG